LFTEPSPVSPVKQASYHHPSLALESEFHLQQFPCNWILEADAKPKEQTTLFQLQYFIFHAHNAFSNGNS